MMLSNGVPARRRCMQSSQLRIPLGQGCFAQLPLHFCRMVSRSYSIASCAMCRARGTAQCVRRPTSGASGPLPTATACTRCSCASRCAPVHCCRCGSLAAARVVIAAARSALSLWLLHVVLARIHAKASSCAQVGGRLVYSTCTFNPIEDEAVVAEVCLPVCWLGDRMCLPAPSSPTCHRRQRIMC